MKILFLDMDGVVNSMNYFMRNEHTLTSKRAARKAKGIAKAEHRWIDMIDPEPVHLLNKIIIATGAKVVLSSSWRIACPFKDVESYLREHGFIGEIIDATQHYSDAGDDRGHQIQDWLNLNPQVTSFAILDDSNDMVHLTDYLVRTSTGTGLRPEHVEPVIALLGAI